MNTRLESNELDDVLDAYLIEVPEPNLDDLNEWVSRYPQYREQLADFTVTRSLMRVLPPVEESLVDEAALMNRGISAMRTALREAREAQGSAYEPTPVSLIQEAKKLGLSLRKVANLSGLSPALWRELDRCFLAKIPAEVIRDVARAIELGPDVVMRYSQSGPRFVAAYHRADQAPTLASPRDFFEAVREDPTLSEERREYLLSLESSSERATESLPE